MKATIFGGSNFTVMPLRCYHEHGPSLRGRPGVVCPLRTNLENRADFNEMYPTPRPLPFTATHNYILHNTYYIINIINIKPIVLFDLFP